MLFVFSSCILVIPSWVDTLALMVLYFESVLGYQVFEFIQRHQFQIPRKSTMKWLRFCLPYTLIQSGYIHFKRGVQLWMEALGDLTLLFKLIGELSDTLLVERGFLRLSQLFHPFHEIADVYQYWEVFVGSNLGGSKECHHTRFSKKEFDVGFKHFGWTPSLNTSWPDRRNCCTRNIKHGHASDYELSSDSLLEDLTSDSEGDEFCQDGAQLLALTLATLGSVSEGALVEASEGWAAHNLSYLENSAHALKASWSRDHLSESCHSMWVGMMNQDIDLVICYLMGVLLHAWTFLESQEHLSHGYGQSWLHWESLLHGDGDWWLCIAVKVLCANLVELLDLSCIERGDAQVGSREGEVTKRFANEALARFMPTQINPKYFKSATSVFVQSFSVIWLEAKHVDHLHLSSRGKRGNMHC